MKTKKLTLIFALLLGISLSVSAQSFLKTQLKNADGKQSSILKEAGESEIIVLDFWTTWCKPCIKSIPKISELNMEFKDKGVKFIGINADSPRNLAKVRPFVKTHKIEYPVLLDTRQELMNELLVNAFPTLLILNNKGETLYSHIGFSNGDEKLIKNELVKLLGDGQ